MTSLLIALAVSVAAPVPKDDKADREFREKVDAVRLKAVKYLKDNQDREGSWESVALNTVVGFKGGTTALVALALLEAGMEPKDPAVAKAVEYLLTLKPDKTYVVGLHTQVLARVDAKKYAKEIQANADWLMEAAITKDKKLQGWSYPANAIGDNSNTHFAVMGLHAAVQAGAKVDADIWAKIRDYYAATQHTDGGWPYHNAGDRKSTRTMTTAALFGLATAAKYDKQAKKPDPAFEKGMEILLGGKLSDGMSATYELFVTAELGAALGVQEFKSGKLAKAWYREGVEKIAKEQQADGSWKSGQRGIDTNTPVISTAYGLYFLGPPAKNKK